MNNTFANAPIGVFDSGIGGLSVLQALRHELPHERFVYLADSLHAPYGERGDEFVIDRTRRITHYLLHTHRIKALVIACNTATAAAVEQLRAELPQLAMVGVEPAVKPASRSSQTHHVGVMATRGTVQSRRFARLVREHGEHTHWHVQACDGLARAIERSTHPVDADTVCHDAMAEVTQLCAQYTHAMGSFGVKTGQIDTLVLGCTHYIFAKDILRHLLGPDVQLIDTGAAVARQTRRILAEKNLLATEPQTSAPDSYKFYSGGLSDCEQVAPASQIQLLTTGALQDLQAAAKHWLDLPASCCRALEQDVSPTQTNTSLGRCHL